MKALKQLVFVGLSLLLQIGLSLASIQCYHCSDRMSLATEPESSVASSEHVNSCAEMESVMKLSCPTLSACSKLTFRYELEHKSPPDYEAKELVQRSCWDPQKFGGRNYTAGKCYWDESEGTLHPKEVCICKGNYCNAAITHVLSMTWIQATLGLAYFTHRVTYSQF